MENASKALLMAAGVLIAILALTLFTYIFQTMGDNASNIYDMLNQSEIDQFNQQFFNFENKVATGTLQLTMQDVITIVHLAKNNNIEGNLPVTVKVTVEGVIVKGTVEPKDDWQEKTEDRLIEILKDNFDKTFTECKVEYAPNSKLVGKISIK